MPPERHVAELLHEVFRRGGLVRGVQRAEAVLLWPQVVGSEVARFSSAVALRAGTLVVDVPDPETALHLGMQRHHVLAAYRDRLGPGAVREVRFRVGRPAEEPTPPPGPPAPEPEAEDVAALARGLHGLDPALAGPALRAGKALLGLRARRLAEGWRPCTVCTGLREPEGGTARGEATVSIGGLRVALGDWCPTCRRQAATPRVQRAAMGLCVAPTDPCAALTPEERAVAVRLASLRLAALAAELLPQALGERALRGQLAHVARAHAALLHGVDVGEVRRHHLEGTVEPAVLRALGPEADGADEPDGAGG